MKIAFWIGVFLGLALSGFCQPSLSGSAAAVEPVGRDPEARPYPALQIGQLMWMTENLDYVVPQSWCYGDDPANCGRYGRLYSWAAAQAACRAVGWRLPTDAEWRTMVQHYGQGSARRAYGLLLVGGSSGFQATLSGFRQPGGDYHDLGTTGHYWTDTEYDADRAWYYSFDRPGRSLYRYYGKKSSGRYCRCVRVAP